MPRKKICQNCGRIFYPQKDADTCLLCQNGLIIKLPKPPEKKAGGRPKKKKFWLQCKKCDQYFWSKDKIYNRLCPSCTEINANISILAIPNPRGNLINSDY